MPALTIPTTTRYPTQTTARQTMLAPQAPGVVMPSPYPTTRPAVERVQTPEGYATNYNTPLAQFKAGVQADILGNRRTYQNALAAARLIADPVQRRLAIQQATTNARNAYQGIRARRPGQAPVAQPQAQPGFQDVRGESLQQSAGVGGAPAPQAPPPPRYQASIARPGTAPPPGAVALPGGPPALPGPSGNLASQPQGPIQYPLGSGSVFGTRDTSDIVNRGAGPYGGPRQTQIGQQAISNYRNAQQALLGPLAGVFGLNQPGNDFTLTRGDVPLLEAGLNFENVLLAERDRELGFNELARGANAVGQDPQSQRLRQLLGYQSEGNASPELAQALALAQARATRSQDPTNDRQATVLKDQFNRDTEGAFRDLREDYARRGISGSEIALDEARIRQEGGSGLNRALAELEARRDDAQRLDIAQLGDLSGQKDSFQRQALEQLQSQIAREEGQRDAYNQALANVFLETERGEFDLSGLTTPLKDKIAGLPVAGPNKIRLTEKDVPQRRKAKGYVFGQTDPILRV